jgi:hypothetical protein
MNNDRPITKMQTAVLVADIQESVGLARSRLERSSTQLWDLMKLPTTQETLYELRGVRSQLAPMLLKLSSLEQRLNESLKNF